MPDFLLKPVPHDEAAKFIASKPILARQAFDHLLPDLKARAFTITGVEAANVMQNVRDRIAELPQGADWDKVKADVAAQVSPWLDSPEEKKADLSAEARTAPSERRAELLLRTHGFQAYAVAAEEVGDRQRDAFPYCQYLGMDDERERPSHAALNDLVLPADDPFWATHTGPWDWGCRCLKIWLARDDVAQMQQEDAKKVPEARRVVTGERLKALQENRLITAGRGGMPQFVSVTPSKTYTFNPKTIKMNAEQLRPRYDAETFATFETWARQQQLGEGRGTVWQWLTAPKARQHPMPTMQPPVAPTPPEPSAPATPPAVSTPVTSSPIVPAATPARVAPVSAALEVRTSGAHKPQIEATLAAIDHVHDDGDLPAIPIIGSTGGMARGTYQMTRLGGKPVQIAIENVPQYWPALTTAHEVGHFLDHQVLGLRGEFASASHPELAEFRRAVLGTRAVAEIRNAFSGRQQEYYLSLHELWARAYAQYVAQKSGSPLLAEQLSRARNGRLQPASLQWTDEDFAPVAAAIDQLLKGKGWA